MRNAIVFASCGFALLFVGSPARGEESELAARARILATEARRGPVEALDTWLNDDPNQPGPVDPALWRRAVVALGRIGKEAVPRLEALLAQDEVPDRSLLLWCAGLAMDKGLAPGVRAHLAAPDVEVRAAAAEALGWCGEGGLLDDLGPLLLDPEPRVRRSALVGLARGGREGALERVVAFLGDDEPAVATAAWHAAWRLAARRREAAREKMAWNGDAALAARLVRDHGAHAARRAELARVLASLLPANAALPNAADDALLAAWLALGRGDLRGDIEVLARMPREREGPAIELLLQEGLRHDDARVRALAYEMLPARHVVARESIDALLADPEGDPRLVHVAVRRYAQGVGSPGDLPAPELPAAAFDFDAVSAETTALEIGLVWQPAGWFENRHACTEAEKGQFREATWMAVFEHAGKPLASPEAAEARRAWLVPFLASDRLRRERPYLVAFALGAYEKWTSPETDAAVLAGAPAMFDVLPRPDVEIERAWVGALAARLVGLEGEARAPFVAALERAATAAQSAFSLAAAREALKQAGVGGSWPPAAANDWRGLPRPQQPLPAWALTGSGPMLDEREILSIAEWIQASGCAIVLETTRGTMRMRVDADAAPIHAVARVLAAHEGLYVGTRWHRVVPNFVIQGADPHGHGAGNAGWTLPDEITRRPFAKGAVGMPKSVKDDGGCQIFIMLDDYAPLDDRYTCCGFIEGTLGAVEATRLGDRILAVRLEYGTPR